jgi:hypothetical protein
MSIFVDSATNDAGSVIPSPEPGMQMRSFLRRKPNQRQWAEKVLCTPIYKAIAKGKPKSAWHLYFSVKVPLDWQQHTEPTKIHTFHPAMAGSNYYRVYIVDDQFWFLSQGSLDYPVQNYFAPIKFGVEQHFEIHNNIELDTGISWVEMFIDQTSTGSSNPLPGQFVPRTKFLWDMTDINAYLQIGLDTGGGGMPEGIDSRYLDWTLHRMTF